MQTRLCIAAALATGTAGGIAAAQPVQLQVTVENLASPNGISFAPLRVGFHDGTFDVFDEGGVATAPIISIAEGGSGADWFPAFASQQPGGVSGTIANGGPLLPGATATNTFTVDASSNAFFTFAAMVVPSNDYFIGNDSPTAYRLFDSAGTFLPTVITQYGRDIWDAGSEVDGPFGAAFLPGSNNDDHLDQNGTIEFDFAGLSVFQGLQTAAGYTFNDLPTADGAVYRITITQVPTPAGAGLLAMAGLAAARRRRS